MVRLIKCWSISLLVGIGIAAKGQNIPNGSTIPSVFGVRTLPASYSGTPPNYLRVFSPQIPISDTSTINMSATVETVQTAITYSDSYGRPLETVAKQLSPAKKDNISVSYYDEFGRSGSFSYLPFADTSSSGLFKTNPFYKDSVFYKTLFPDEQVFYQQTLYDSSPFNIPIKKMAEGNEWGGSHRGDTMIHRSNATSDSVRYWSISISSENDIPSTSTYYVAGSLSVNQVTDARGIKSIVYKDMAGRIILTKSQIASSPATGHWGWLCTYYIYDEMGHLRAIIPPKATDALIAVSWNLSSNATIYTGFCYSYYYDSRGRQIVKYIPGKGKNYTAYDLLDRPVMTQDPNLRNSNQWTFILYDAQQRPVKSGVITTTATTDTIWAQAARNTSYPTLSGTYTIMAESYYDDYDWISATSAPVASSPDFSNFTSAYFITSSGSPYYAETPTSSLRIRGAMTGNKILVLGTSNYLYNVSFFDTRGRVIQSQQYNYTGGTDVSTTQYNFRNNVLRNLLVHVKSGTNAQTHKVLTKYEYAHTGKLLSMIKNIDSTGDKTIEQNTYAETGLLKTTILGNNIYTENFSYNIRGMITGINSDYATDPSSDTSSFGESISYAHGFSIPQYNGLVSGVVWKTGGDHVQRAYGYDYDKAGRLATADFQQFNSDNSTWSNSTVDYSVRNLTYDAAGNILSMTQKGLLGVGGSDIIDSLAYTYFSNSNKLRKVADVATSFNLGDFSDSTNTGDDYAYDSSGNIIKDYNRHMYTGSGSRGAVFNMLDKPDSIVVAGKSCTYYTYDAAGNTLKKKVNDYVHGTVSTYTYLSGFVYLNDTLQFTGMEVGRIRLKTVGGTKLSIYDYLVKDHGGNVRVVLTDEQRQDVYPMATMETADTATQSLYYNNISATYFAKPTGFPAEDSVSNFVAKVQNGGGGPHAGESDRLYHVAGAGRTEARPDPRHGPGFLRRAHRDVSAGRRPRADAAVTRAHAKRCHAEVLRSILHIRPDASEYLSMTSVG